jgi:putative ABC transport system permease protein
VRTWRTALRIAYREARRAKGRTALVLAMITLPVFGLAFAAVTSDMFALTPAEKIDRQIGAADARISWPVREPVRQDLKAERWESAGNGESKQATTDEVLSHLPPGSRATLLDGGYWDMRTATGIGGMEIVGVDPTDPVTAGFVSLLDGREPRTENEIAVTRAAADRLGTEIGGTVTTADRKRTLSVVGVVEFPDDLGERIVVPPGRAGDRVWFVDTPTAPDWTEVRRLNALGIVALSRAVTLDPPASPEGALEPWPEGSTGLVKTAAIVGGLALFEVILLAAPAFVIGAKRRRRDLALVAANGGTPQHLRRIVLADGVVVGIAGAILGVALGVLIAFAARPLVEVYLADRRAGGYRVYPVALLGVAALALLTGVIAALVPAISSARQDVVAGLTGRRGAVRTKRRWIVAGFVLVTAGTALAGLGAFQVRELVILAGLVVGELGLVLCTPALVGLVAAMGKSLPLGPRIALRDASRNRAAAAPAISAVMAAVAGAVALGTYLASDTTRQQDTYEPSLPIGYVAIHVDREAGTPPSQDEVLAAVGPILAVTDIRPVDGIGCLADAPAGSYCDVQLMLPPARVCPYEQMQWPLPDDLRTAALADPRCNQPFEGYVGSGFATVVGEGSPLPLITGASAADVRGATETLRAGGVVVHDARYVEGGKVTIGYPGKTDLQKLTVPAYVLGSGDGGMSTFVSPAVAAKTGLPTVPSGWVVATSATPDQADVDALNAALAELPAKLTAYVEDGGLFEDDTTAIGLAIVAALIALGATAVATGLAAADGRADLSTLAAVGAGPGVRRVLSLSQSGVIAGLGSFLGAAAGLGAGFVLLAAFNRARADEWPVSTPYPMVMPWWALSVLIVIPVVAMLGAGLLTRARLPIERRLT